MASFTFSSVGDLFGVGTSVGAYLPNLIPGASSPVTGAAVVTATVQADGSLTFTGLADDTKYVAYDSGSGKSRRFRSAPSVGSGSTGAVSTLEARFGLRPDAKTLIDGVMTAGAAALAHASGTFAQSDVGKTVVVNGAGSAAVATTSSALLSTGAPITSLPVAALPSAIPAGGVIIRSGSNSQVFRTTGAASSATSIPVLSLTPTFAFPSASVVSTLPAPLKTTILSVQSATAVTLAAPAAWDVTGAEVVYGTNNLIGLQAAIDAAIAAKTSLHIASAVEGYLYDGTLTVSDSLDITGNGARDLFETASGGSFNALNFPTIAPYLEGSVLICAAQNADALLLTGIGAVGDLSGFGIRFAGSFRSTGHGINVLPPIYSGSYRDHGMLNSRWESLRVYGHDGDHYAYRICNSMYATLVHLRSYGGGHLDLWQVSGVCPYGNILILHPFGVVLVAGSAHATWIHNDANLGPGNAINYIVAIRPQMWILNPLPLIPTIPGPLTTQSNWTYAGTVGGVNKVSIITPDFETNCGATAVLGGTVVTGQIIGGGSTTGNTPGGGSSFTTFPATGTIYQNLEGVPVILHMQYNLTPIAASLSSALTTGAPITSLPVDALTVAIPSGSTVVTVSGAKTQSWTTTGTASVSATSIPVTSQTPNFAYPIGTIAGVAASVLAEVSGASNMSGALVLAEIIVPAGAVGLWRQSITVMVNRGQYYRATETNAAKFRSAYVLGVVGST